MKRFNKNGSHVGVIISFVMFITFLIFLYLIITPTINKQKDKSSVLNNLEKRLIENLSSDLTFLSLKVIADSGGAQCVNLVNFSIDSEMDFNLVIKDQDGMTRTAHKKDPELQIGGNGLNFLKVYNSEEFNELDDEINQNCEVLIKDEGNYSFGLMRTQKYVFEKKIFSLLNTYKNDYENLKEEFSIPRGSEFAFSFKLNNESTIGRNELNLSTSIYEKRILTAYVDNNTNIVPGYLNIKVW